MLRVLERHKVPASSVIAVIAVMNGYALAARLRALAANLRLVALTGYGQRADVARAAGAGFDLHLTKPATLDDLQRALASA